MCISSSRHRTVELVTFVIKSAFASTDPRAEFQADAFRSPISLDHMERLDGPPVLAGRRIVRLAVSRRADHNLLPPVAIETTAFEEEVVDRRVKKPREQSAAAAAQGN
ncbi:hypothetical protein M427DRAFT_38746 [Gonapodya prolifera JEL478]|uniref:Uncharacterized protein n=1 Tax=Gonapodya prolifera (strain JEL478) TaxID=1344416 RepID=A0A138ZYD8_GONPJ|nr:hypothetical protein M427DRAFT_38746 [Gonapodya prolifera JEL478]|eukprot:KXS09522.1 hypothetical protein M427DRAFT_38746 [Gonapodya prolifera JEL478]